jgi:thioredoxin reductase (NADPH)
MCASAVVERNGLAPEDVLDCLIVGGGPAGLMAATYLGRFRRRVLVVDAGESRARWIPMTRNCPGFPGGITGVDLLARMREQAVRYGARIVNDTVHDISLGDGVFTAATSYRIRARSVVLAAGIVDTLPDSPDVFRMIEAGTLRLCPICDGYEVIGKRIAVVGPLQDAVKKALFLRTFSSDVTILVTDGVASEPDVHTQLVRAGIDIEACRPDTIRAAGAQAGATLANGRSLTFDTVYPAMGCTMRSALATKLGAACDELGNLLADSHQRTVVPGLYAIGDVVNEINQLAVAFGHAAIAASDVHNALAERHGERPL